jgi:beta-galactosidase
VEHRQRDPRAGGPEGWKVARRLTDICHEEDKTRPTTAGFNQIEAAIRNKLADQVDIPGFNYGERQYAKIVEEHPAGRSWPRETASCVSSRGVYHLPIENYEKHDSLQITSYDVVAPGWAYCPDVEFARLEAVPSVLGEFVWTGFDYLGEPTPVLRLEQAARREGLAVAQLVLRDRRPRRLPEGPLLPLPEPLDEGADGARAAALELGRTRGPGDPGDGVHERRGGRAAAERPLARAQEEGRGVRAARQPEGEQRPALHDEVPARLAGAVPAGTLEAVAYAGGKPVAKSVVKTAGAPRASRSRRIARQIKADGEDLSFVTVRVEDKDGNSVPGADNLVRFTIEGKGSLAAVDNGNAASVESFQAPSERPSAAWRSSSCARAAASPDAIEVKPNPTADSRAATITTAR